MQLTLLLLKSYGDLKCRAFAWSIIHFRILQVLLHGVQLLGSNPGIHSCNMDIIAYAKVLKSFLCAPRTYTLRHKLTILTGARRQHPPRREAVTATAPPVERSGPEQKLSSRVPTQFGEFVVAKLGQVNIPFSESWWASGSASSNQRALRPAISPLSSL